jgi:plastocyanin
VAPEELDVTIRNFAFKPAQLRATSGAQVRVNLTNKGKVMHNITIADANVNQDVDPRATATATFTAPGPGDHPFFCRIHPRRMTGTLTVQ